MDWRSGERPEGKGRDKVIGEGRKREEEEKWGKDYKVFRLKDIGEEKEEQKGRASFRKEPIQPSKSHVSQYNELLY